MRQLDHVGIAVHSLDSAASTFAALLAGSRTDPVVVTDQAVRICFVDTAVGSLELLQPLVSESPVGRFLERRGEGLHHLCYAVPDLSQELARLAGAGVELVDRVPRLGPRGLVAFVHPRSTNGVLLELLERK